jgi:2-polyprenyl-3-methyl-5-hydroxy-6-metoxy-1,4-benzoquinol methylase/uncharacterized protein YbaR (Trm112 family)
MDKKNLDILVCPRCGSPLYVSEDAHKSNGTSALNCTENGHLYPIKNGIPRFVDFGNYAESFGFQWKKFSRVQLDSYNGTGFSEERFKSITSWNRDNLAGKLILDAGCGAGRFSEVVLKYGGRLTAIDLSEAVDALRENLSPAEPLVCQASIYELPFRAGTFDYVYCIGVVQHTPDPEETIRALCKMVKPGGHIGLWIYEHDWKSYLGTLGFKYALRPVLRRLSRSRQFAISKTLVDLFFPIASILKSRGFFGKLIMRLLPVASAHLQSVPLSVEDFKTWVLLDTFDMYSPAYDKPQTYKKVSGLLAEEGFGSIQRHPHGGISITAVRRV